VTGTEPLAADLEDEPFWGSLTRVLEWAEEHTYSTILSCLAAHAGILHLDGIARRPLGDKRFGVFECVRASDHPLIAGAPGRLQMPHSRWNEIPEEALLACGYRVLTRSEDAGVDAFVKQRKSLFVFFQGHPEYEATTLLLEYRRDIGRFLRRERDGYPPMPHGYFDPEIASAGGPAERALIDRREELLAEPDRHSGTQGDQQLAIDGGNRHNWLLSPEKRKLSWAKGRMRASAAGAGPGGPSCGGASRGPVHAGSEGRRRESGTPPPHARSTSRLVDGRLGRRAIMRRSASPAIRRCLTPSLALPSVRCWRKMLLPATNAGFSRM
jgi:GMP synthase-like glutamine amidotransferase